VQAAALVGERRSTVDFDRAFVRWRLTHRRARDVLGFVRATDENESDGDSVRAHG
jgi:hypothetical protein